MKNQQRNGFTVWEILGCLAIIGVGTALMIPFFAQSRETNCKTTCATKLKRIGVGVLQYTQDFDEHLPLVSVSTKSTMSDSKISWPKKQAYGWTDALYPYLKSEQDFQCPDERNRSSVLPTQTGYTDYWFNANLSGLDWGKNNTGQAAITIAFGDGNDGSDLTDARYNLPALPDAWIKDQSSPAYRHNGMANYGFLDGHVKALPPSDVTNEPIANGKTTFKVK